MVFPKKELKLKNVLFLPQITQTLNMMVRQTSEVEANIVSVERAKEYAEVSTEAAWILPDSRPPDEWPREGKIQIDAYNLRYREELPLVLKNIDCVFYPGEKVMNVGHSSLVSYSLLPLTTMTIDSFLQKFRFSCTTDWHRWPHRSR